MRQVYLLIISAAFLLLSYIPSGAQPQKDVVDYDTYFTAERLRVDMVFAGNSTYQQIFFKGLHKEKEWSGSRINLIDPFEYGEYYYNVYAGDKLIFSKGFCTIFQEWRTTAEAKIRDRAYPTCVWMPFPKQEVKIVFYERDRATAQFKELNSFMINPAHKAISCEKENDYEPISLLKSGDNATKVDLLFIAEGYTADEMGKFRKDCSKFIDYLFTMEPYKSRKSDFNIWCIESASKESGPDIPQNDQWRNTVAGAHFYTFDIDRYMTAPDQILIGALASNAPFDALYVIVNTEKYGGGGVYNFYGLSMSDDPRGKNTECAVFVHEFGHSFAGLGDEYYTSDVAYEDFYNLKTEPWEPNLTTLVDFDKKWKGMIKPSTPQPTPNTKQYGHLVGLFEGGGYMAKGIYRPYLDCRMITNTADGFCPVCQKAISDMIDFYCR